MAGFKIGTTKEGMASIESLATPLPAPRARYQPGSERVTLASGQERWIGWPVAVWEFPQLTEAQRDALRGFCSGASATVYIATLIDSAGKTYDDFQAVMVWPEEEDRRAGYAFGLEIKFQALVAV